mmetsp:Transcript_23716/g.61599  ORF Transcript_23716/g.61599 Transcript_23716/m.61599 type:complete len:283 (-) Transcript_23716:140-988(-)|eukprot:jgi/Tetstr1/439146/TSEL_027598.t1
MSSLAGLAAVPVLGGSLYIGFLAAAQYADLAVQRTEAQGRRVLPRPWSIVSDDARAWGHWLTLAAACAFAATVPATSVWQNSAAGGGGDAPMVVSASLAAAAFFLMAMVPHRDSRSAPGVTLSAVWHLVTAGGFLGLGTFHATRSMFFALDSFETSAVFAARAAFVSVMGLCVLAQLCGGLYLYFLSAKAFNKHYYPMDGGKPDLSKLSGAEDLLLRRKMFFLFVLQAIWGIAYGALIATCAAELSRLNTGDALAGAIVAGAASAGSIILSAASYGYFTCRA